MRKLVSTLLSTLFLAAAAAAAEPIKIGAPQPMTGPDAPFGDKFKKAYGMALEEINAAGGINGRKLEIVIEDHQAKNALAATIAEKLITQEKVLVMTGGRASGQAMEIASVSQRLNTPYLVDHPSADMITAKGFEWVFRNNPTGSIYPQAFLDFIANHPGAMPKSAAGVYDNTLFGKTIAAAVMKQLKARNVPIVADEGLKQMICNVLDNALEASPEHVTLAVHAGPRDLVIRVLDEGPGFTPAMLGHFGRPYHSTKGRSGSGLGLFLSLNVARGFGGNIFAQNRDNGGAVVTVVLPLKALVLDDEESDDE